MTDARATIPVVPMQSPEEARREIGGCAEAEPYALRVIGDSMAPEFLDGHIVIVDPAMAGHAGGFVIVEQAGATALRQLVYRDGRTYLRALNPAYPEVELGGDCRVRGVVVQRAGRGRKDRRHYYGNL